MMNYYKDSAGQVYAYDDAQVSSGYVRDGLTLMNEGEVAAHLYPEPEPQTLEEAIAAKLAELDDYRWQVEISGAEMAGITIRTDPNSQAKVAAAYTMARLDPAYEVPTWEALPGLFIPLSNAQLVSMGEAVRDHVQATFNRKAVLHGQISALENIEAVDAFDIASEW